MNHIPEDSVLRRHYLTELKNKQRSTFDAFLDEATKPTPPPSRVIQEIDFFDGSGRFVVFATAFVVFSLIVFIF